MNTLTRITTVSHSQNLVQPELLQNKKRVALRYMNYRFIFKAFYKTSCLFTCATPGCKAAISISARDREIIKPIQLIYYKNEHKCEPKDDEYFEIKEFLRKVGEDLTKNTTKSTY